MDAGCAVSGAGSNADAGAAAIAGARSKSDRWRAGHGRRGSDFRYADASAMGAAERQRTAGRSRGAAAVSGRTGADAAFADERHAAPTASAESGDGHASTGAAGEEPVGSMMIITISEGGDWAQMKAEGLVESFAEVMTEAASSILGDAGDIPISIMIFPDDGNR